MVDLTGYKLTFDDEFNDLSVSQTGAATTWADIRAQWRFDKYSDIGFGKSSFMDPGSGYDPFGIANGALSITASPNSTPYGYPGSWESGLLSSKASLSQTYGYFEIRANFSETVGAWDALWLLPENPVHTGKSGWQELDVVEHYGSDPTAVYSTIHTTDSTSTPQVYSKHPTITSGYHTYGMDWEKDTIKFYVDGVLTGTKATPSDMHGPMYLLADLATRSYVGATGAPMISKIDYIRAYSSDPNATAVALGGISSPDGQDPGLHGASALGPTVSITTQTLAADTGASTSDRITNDGAVTLAGIVTGSPGTGVQVYDGTALLGAATLTVSGGWTYAVTLAAGAHALHAVATDLAGNSTATAAMPTITVETAPPAVAVTSETPNAAGTGETIEGTVSGPPGSTVILYNGSTALGTALLDGQGGWSFSATLDPGTYNLSAVATDLAGNTASVDPTFTTTSDTLALKIPEDAPDGGVPFVVSVDGKQIGATRTVTALDQSRNVVMTGAFGPGMHDVVVTFLDADGGSASTDRNFYVNTFTLDGKTCSNALYGGGAFNTFLAGDANGAHNEIHGGASQMNGVAGYTNNTVSFADTPAAESIYVDLLKGHNVFVNSNATNTGDYAFEDLILNVPNVIGSSNRDVIRADNGTDKIQGGVGGDALYCGTGIDTFVYSGYADSNTVKGYDSILGFATGKAKIDLSAFNSTAAHLVIASNSTSTALYLEQTPGAFDASTDLAISFIGAHAVKASDVVF